MSRHVELWRRRHAAQQVSDRALGMAVLRDLAAGLGLDADDVQRRPKMARHTILRRAVVDGLMSLGWSNRRARLSIGLTSWARRVPPLDLVARATEVAGRLHADHRKRVRAMAVQIDAADGEERARLIEACDDMGVDVAELAKAVGVTSNTIARWRDPMWEEKRMLRDRNRASSVVVSHAVTC